jgi:hypothetical protein
MNSSPQLLHSHDTVHKGETVVSQRRTLSLSFRLDNRADISTNAESLARQLALSSCIFLYTKVPHLSRIESCIKSSSKVPAFLEPLYSVLKGEALLELIPLGYGLRELSPLGMAGCEGAHRTESS